MTDTGQIPGEGLPENAGMVEQPGIPAPGAYTFLGPSENGPEEDDLLLMPGAQGAWSDPQPGAAPGMGAQGPVAQTPVAQMPMAPAPAHAAGGLAPVAVPVSRDQAPTPEQMASGRQFSEHQVFEQQFSEHLGSEQHVGVSASAQLSAGQEFAGQEFVSQEFAAPESAATVEPVAPAFAEEPAAAAAEAFAPAAQVPPLSEPGAHESGGRDSGSVDLNGVRIPPTSATPTPPPARRPLHMGPPVPDSTGGVVRSLADRGPAGTTPPHAVPAPGPASPATGLEYLDIPRDGSAGTLPGPQLGEIPPQAGAPWDPQPPQPQMFTAVPAETVVPEPAPVVAEAVAVPAPAPEPTPAGQFVPVDGPLPAMPYLAAAPVDVPVQREMVQPEMVQVEMMQQEPEPERAAGPVPVQEAEAVVEPEPVSLPEPEAGAKVPAPRDGGWDMPQEVSAETAAQPDPEVEPEPESAPEVIEAMNVAEVVEAEEPAPAPEPASESAPAPEFAPAPEPEPEQMPAAAAARPAPAPAPGYDDAEREAVLRVMRERRDIRNGFRSDPIPHEVLLRVLEAAHTAPSVGHSQPWDFVVIRSAETRRTMHELAQRQREAYAKSLPKGRAKQFKELKIEAILDTPVNIVVTADPTRGGRHTLGRHTQPQMAPYSSALAVENLWLAARAEGLGVGWVSFFDEREMVRALGLPEHLEVVAYLCVGYVDEFPEEPELMQAGWSKRRPLSWVVHEETYGRRALPGEEPHDLLQETVSNIRPLDAKALGEAWERQKRMTKPAGALGMLEIISAQLSGLSRMCPPPIPEPAAVAIFAGDHGVHAQGVTAWPQEVTAQMVANFLGGGAVCNAFANQVGAEVCVIDVGVAGDLPATPGLLPRKVRPGTADFTTGLALSREEVLSAVEVGIETARDLVAAGNKALLTGEMGIANTTVSAALISVYTEIDPSEITGRGTGINDEMHARKVDVVRRALELHAPDPADPIGVLSAVGGLEHAALVGFILGGASLRTPVVLDGVSAGAAALVARAIAPEALAACIAGHRSAEPGHVAALNKLGLRPLVDLDLRLGEGTGALLALPVVQSAARAMHEVATFDSAGVTEK
ncbi:MULTISPECIES: nicotinate-nucleotide--dimethylbenzimidazole phosphoribosyltransferase [unclassified Streptomyces]|uniref:nicotinate-nucleotide--dimethylbenzimidazole phosphoribosyltransferase n=1 Tax=unclassified Streptomyces TaxID=2593676 RepID=UPI002DDA7569|nr:nicotinate-nucleotide--dimethylbenzimidazole phosphoribosyltransferase [Streptomyces sp. NBC_01750]WSB03944.1 nicotinate-nucleotide--dimethylbenzimidazole phosphoribosyltransferase [Streptomyces sp. NBC_01794]WSD31770.1 nicotinate-nucleotide--dimethylbenzimidazole phosphoribosyltransferase [Streptomyces sp. NBC_01750]